MEFCLSRNRTDESIAHPGLQPNVTPVAATRPFALVSIIVECCVLICITKVLWVFKVRVLVV